MLDKIKKTLQYIKKYSTKRNIIIASCAIVSLITITVLFIVFFNPENKNHIDADNNIYSSAPNTPSDSIPTTEEIGLTITSPAEDEYTTDEPSAVISGTCDPSAELLMNGQAISPDDDGNFSVDVNLKVGKNSFEFTHKGQTITKIIKYNYVVIKEFAPSRSQSYSSGSVITVNVTARADSTVTATLNGETVKCTKKTIQGNDENDETSGGSFCNFSGTFNLPSGNASDINLGKIEFTATSGGVTQKCYSGKITVNKSSIIKGSDPTVTPSGGNYIDVGSGLIATIITRSAETFNGNSVDDYSRPTNNYLPEGTVDYCAEGVITSGNNQYLKLRCGKRVYTVSNPGKSYEQQVATTQIGVLPDHNEISFSSFETGQRYTILKLDTDWKAPFYFDILNQSYTNPTIQDYSMSAVTFSYIDITFCYSTVFEGEIEIPENHPIFKSAEIIKNEFDYTLRLTLNKTGGFYGWDCYYDSEGKLTFEFLNPAKMESNSSLNGIKVFLDIGHGGNDTGALGSTYGINEATQNLFLGLKVKSKLEALGAEVVMSRNDNSTSISPPNRMNMLRDADADFCLAIHHDSNLSSSANGFLSAHFTPYSKTAADYINTQTTNAGIYNRIRNVESHYYYMARVTNCPVVLTENGFMSNKADYKGITDDATCEKKAQALTDAVLDYFRSIQ